MKNEEEQEAYEDYFNALIDDEIREQEIKIKILEIVKSKVSEDLFNEIEQVIEYDSEHVWNFKITDHPKGEYQTESEFPILNGYWVDQTVNGGYAGDDFAGTISLEFKKGEFLEWEYSC